MKIKDGTDCSSKMHMRTCFEGRKEVVGHECVGMRTCVALSTNLQFRCNNLRVRSAGLIVSVPGLRLVFSPPHLSNIEHENDVFLDYNKE